MVFLKVAEIPVHSNNLHWSSLGGSLEIKWGIFLLKVQFCGLDCYADQCWQWSESRAAQNVGVELPTFCMWWTLSRKKVPPCDSYSTAFENVSFSSCFVLLAYCVVYTKNPCYFVYYYFLKVSWSICHLLQQRKFSDHEHWRCKDPYYHKITHTCTSSGYIPDWSF